MAKLTLQEQLLKAGLVTSKKAAKVERTAKKSRVQAREARAAVEENKKAQLERDKQLSEQQKQAVVWRLLACWSITIAKVNTPLFPPALPIKLLSVMPAVLCCTARSAPKSRMKTIRMPTSKCLMI